MDPTEAVEFLVKQAGVGPALELAIGTGRVALPLAARGIDVHGIDISEPMVARLREKPGGQDIPVTIGDFADVGVEGSYPLIYLVFNTLFGLLTQDEQVRCFENVAEHLEPRGVFVIEAFVPDVTHYNQNQRTSTIGIETESVVLAVSLLDAATQVVDSSHVVLRQGDVRLYPVRIRFAYPSELDLMARIAGLRLRERWGSWAREPYTGEGEHVSVYEKPSH